jgi:hypothetical protein
MRRDMSRRFVLAAAAALLMLLPASAQAASGVRVTATGPATATQGQTVTVTVRVTNPTSRRMRGLRLIVAAPAGIGAAPASRSLPTLGPHRHATVAVRLQPGSGVTGDTTTTVTVRGGGKPRGSAVVHLTVAPANPLIGRYFFNTYFVGAGTYSVTYYFASDGFAYRGTPEGGLPTCTAPTAQGDGDGCIPYSYDPATGTVAVDGQTGRLSGAHALELDGTSFSEAVTPQAGATFDVYVHSLSGAGICPTACTFVSSDLRLFGDGQFVRAGAASSTTSSGSVTALPASQRGTYAVADGGRITFSYADGRTITETIGVMVEDDVNVDPNYGLLLNGSIYWGPKSGV